MLVCITVYKEKDKGSRECRCKGAKQARGRQVSTNSDFKGNNRGGGGGCTSSSQP